LVPSSRSHSQVLATRPIGLGHVLLAKLTAIRTNYVDHDEMGTTQQLGQRNMVEPKKRPKTAELATIARDNELETTINKTKPTHK
jgi:hypothetical protein